jgi:hypothetical protein
MSTRWYWLLRFRAWRTDRGWIWSEPHLRGRLLDHQGGDR